MQCGVKLKNGYILTVTDLPHDLVRLPMNLKTGHLSIYTQDILLHRTK